MSTIVADLQLPGQDFFQLATDVQTIACVFHAKGRGRSPGPGSALDAGPVDGLAMRPAARRSCCALLPGLIEDLRPRPGELAQLVDEVPLQLRAIVHHGAGGRGLASCSIGA